MIESIVKAELPVDEVLEIKKNRLGDSGKRICVVTGIHGDELEGQYVAYELSRRVKENMQNLNGIVDIYLVDYKYEDSAIARRYSNASDYPTVVKGALAEMVRQCGNAEFDEEDMMQKGVIVRHLLLPGCLENAKAVVKYVFKTYGDKVFLSLMNQYTPLPHVAKWPELNRRVTVEEYEELVDYAIELGVENGFVQEGETAEESFIPEFDNEGWG